MWHWINVIMWLAMVGSIFAPREDQSIKQIAVIGLILALCAQHAAVRGFFRSKKKRPRHADPLATH
jgi:hypothetical protein